MAVNKRGNKWWLDFMFNRTRYRLPSPDNSRAGAQAYETLIRYKLARGEPIKPIKGGDRKAIFRDFADEWFRIYVKNNNKYSEIVTKEMVLRVHLVPHFGKMELEKIGNLDIERFKAKKIAERLNAKTINNHLTILRKSLQCALEWGLMKNLPVIKRLKTLPSKYDFLTSEETGQLTAAADGMWRNMIKAALGTGLRFGEMIALTWDDIDFEKRELTVRQAFAKGLLGSPKSNKARRIPMTKSVYETLKCIERTKEFVFSDKKGRPLHQTACINKLYRICKKAGLRRIGWHCLRHTFASHLAQRGANLVAIQGLLGHSEIRTTMRYAHINDAVLHEAISVLNEKASDNLCHNVVTMPVSEVVTNDISSTGKSIILANPNKKRAEALL